MRLVLAAGLFVVFLAVLASFTYGSVRNQLAPWYGVMVSDDEVGAAQWVDANVPHWQLFSGDLFACEMITAVARQYCSVGGAWELADRANQRFSDNEKVFTTNSSQEAWELENKYNVKYVLVAPREAFYGYGYKQPNVEKFQDTKYFKEIYSVGSAKVYEVVKE